MTERALRLEWNDHGDFLEAVVGDMDMTVWKRSGRWIVEAGRTIASGESSSLHNGQLQCEAVAWKRLREGVEALGGSTLTCEQVALVVEALRLTAAERMFADEFAKCDAMEALAKELADG